MSKVADIAGLVIVLAIIFTLSNSKQNLVTSTTTGFGNLIRAATGR